VKEKGGTIRLSSTNNEQIKSSFKDFNSGGKYNG
jgi:hypothetical protein